MFGSEAKSLATSCDTVDFFPPGCCAIIPLSKPTRSIDFLQYYCLPVHIERPSAMLDLEVGEQQVKATTESYSWRFAKH
jgi:hypothetical protein